MKKTDYKPHIYFCADDFGMSLPTCRRILDCRTHGVLNKISVLPNTKIENISEFLKNCDGLDLSVHINLVEGQCVYDKERLPLLLSMRTDTSKILLRDCFCCRLHTEENSESR